MDAPEPTMTLATGQKTGGKPKCRQAFTLVELILVMTLLAVVMALSAPTLSQFFRGRTLDSEARRFLSLTHYAQSRAVSEGVPMILWIDLEEGIYGLEEEPGYTEGDMQAVEFELGKDLRVELIDSPARDLGGTGFASGGLNASGGFGSGGLGLDRFGGQVVRIRFLPDGTISETSPKDLLIWEGESHSVWIAQSRYGTHYAIQDPDKVEIQTFR
jgi:prepilin-type N-terminal cleavage/methylation domain-containing protein